MSVPTPPIPAAQNQTQYNDIRTVFEESGSEILSKLDTKLKELLSQSFSSIGPFEEDLIRYTGVDNVSIEDKPQEPSQEHKPDQAAPKSVQELLDTVNAYMSDLLVKEYNVDPEQVHRAKVSYFAFPQTSHSGYYHKEKGGNCYGKDSGC